MPHILVSHLVLTFVSDQVTITTKCTNVKHKVRTIGLEHQGQNSISEPGQSFGFTCIFSSGMQENIFYLSGKHIRTLGGWFVSYMVRNSYEVSTPMQFFIAVKTFSGGKF